MAYDEFTAKMVRECERPERPEQENAQLKAINDEFTAKMVRECERPKQENAQLKAINDELSKKVKNLTAWHDKMFGAPCEEIRHQQQVEALEAERDQLKAELAQCQQRAARLRGIVKLLTTGEPGSFLATRFPATLREAKHALEEDKA